MAGKKSDKAELQNTEQGLEAIATFDTIAPKTVGFRFMPLRDGLCLKGGIYIPKDHPLAKADRLRVTIEAVD